VIGAIISFLIGVTALVIDLPPVSPASLEWTYLVIFFAVFIIAVLVFLMIYIFPERREEPVKEKIDKEIIYSIAILSVSAIFGILFLIIAILLQLEKISSLMDIGLTQKNALDFAIFSILTSFGPYSFYGYARFKKIDKMEERFPEFLRDLSESRRAGMTMSRAVETSAQGNYGRLTPEIKKMAIQISWGCNFSEALKLFANRLKTPLIKRSTSLVIKAQEAGGRVSDIIEAAARDCREIKILQDERKMEMKLYLIIVYIAFFVFLAVIVILSDSFVPKLISSTQDAQGIGMIKGGHNIWEYQFIYVCAAISQAIGNGLVGGVLGEGNVPAGLRHGFILVLISYIIFKVIL
jgi:flagellar protein FlaJ